MSGLAFAGICVICVTALIVSVGICSTVEKIHGKDK